MLLVRSRLALAAISIALAAQTTPAQTERYRLTVDNTWSPQTHAGPYPPDAHFSWIAGATHDASEYFWREGELASPGVVEMAETGATFILEAEVASAIARGGAQRVLAWRYWFCPAGSQSIHCGPLTVEFDVDVSHSRVTLATMLGPSPDWFVGVESLPLHDGRCWRDEVVVDLRPFDGGTRSANAYALFGPQTQPPAPISRITTASGQLIGPGSLGTFTFRRVAAASSFGCETPTSAHGAPTLTASCTGTTLELSIVNTSPTTGAATLGFHVFRAPARSPQRSTPFAGLCWNLPLPINGAFIPIAPSSTLRLPLSLSPGSLLAGAQIDWQVYALDPASTSPLGVTTSRGLTTTLPR